MPLKFNPLVFGGLDYFAAGGVSVAEIEAHLFKVLKGEKLEGSGATPAIIELPASGIVHIKKGVLGGVLSVAQVEGLETLVAAGVVEGGALKTGGTLTAGGLVVLGEETPAELEANGRLTPSHDWVRLKASKEVFVTGIAPEGSVPVASYYQIFTNVGTQNIVFSADLYTVAKCHLVKVGNKVTTIEAAKGKELYVGMKVSGAGVAAGSEIATIISETEVALTAEPTEEIESTIKFVANTASQNERMQFSTGLNIKLEPKHSLTMINDLTTKRWRDLAVR